MAKTKDEKTQLPTHGAAVLPSVRVDSYNVEVQDEDGFLGDKASKGAFAEILDKWRKVLKEGDEDPLGDKPTDEVSKKKLAQMLTEGEPEAAAMVQSAVEEFAQQLAQVIRRFLRAEGVARHRMPGDRRRVQRQPPGRAGGRASRLAAAGGRHPRRAGADPQPSR